MDRGRDPDRGSGEAPAGYPEIKPERIIAGTAPVAGITPQDWLNAAIVSMGSMGVVYSMVLQVVPQFGVHEVVVQKTWEDDIWND